MPLRLLQNQSRPSRDVAAQPAPGSAELRPADGPLRRIPAARAARASGAAVRFDRMGRPPLPVGTHGRIDFHYARSGRVRARALFRNFDGAVRPVTRWAGTPAEAEALLVTALRERACFPEADIAGGTRLAAAARVWLTKIDQYGLATGTKQLYQAATRIYLVPTLGQLRLGELNVAVIDRALATVRLHHGPRAARAARRALSSLCGTAVRRGALPSNPGRDTRPITCPRKRVRALTPGESTDLLRRPARRSGGGGA
jgi:hypothetical protein